MRRAILAFVVPALTACGATPAVPAADPPAASSAPPATDPPPSIIEREGPLGVSKGNPTVADVLLAHDPIVARFGRDWRTTAVGTVVRVRGTLRVHVCGPAEQCLTTGRIPILTPDEIEIVSTPPAPPAPPPPPPARPDAAADPTVACLAECQRVSDECDQNAKDDRGRLRRCGSRLMGCRTGCERR